VKATIYLFLAGLVVATGAAQAKPISVANSIYGVATSFTTCDNSTTPMCDTSGAPGATMQDMLVPFSFFTPGATYEDFYFQVDGISSYTLTLKGDANFIADDTVTHEYFGFGAYCPGGNVPPCNASQQSADSTEGDVSDGDENTVTFTVPGNGDGFVFFAIEPVGDPNEVNATLTALTPEPALGPILALAFCGLVIVFQRKRSAKLS